MLKMPADEYLKAVASHPLTKTETIRVSKSIATIEKSFQRAAASCLKQRHAGNDVPPVQTN